MLQISCGCGTTFNALESMKVMTCPQCKKAWYKTIGGEKVIGAEPSGKLIKVSETAKETTRERLAAAWEAEKHKLPDGELKTFICQAVMRCMEEWRGGEPPKPRVVTVEIVTEVEPHECEFQHKDGKQGASCIYCGKSAAEAWPSKWKESDEIYSPKPYGGPISPFAGFNF